jgi:hypothetical protein
MVRNMLFCALAVAFAAAYGPAAYAQDYMPDLKVIRAVVRSKVSLAQALASVQPPAVPISAKFEIEDKPSGKLSLSVYVATLGLHNSTKSAWKEMAGSPETAPWKPTTEVLSEAGDIAAAAAQIRLLAKTHITLAQIARQAQNDLTGTIISITPVSSSGHPQFAVFVENGGTAREIDYDLISGKIPPLAH